MKSVELDNCGTITSTETDSMKSECEGIGRKQRVSEYNKMYYRKNKDTLLPKIRLRARKWELENKPRRNEREKLRRLKLGNKYPNVSATKRYRHKLREEALEVYGKSCACCGETTPEFLTIDHINGGGSKHRSKLKPGGGNFVYWLKKNGYPTGYRTLCWNCNWSAHVGNGMCIHQREKI